jgi:hypothetical protein
MQWLPGLQSLSVWQGHAHLPAAVLQRCVRQAASEAQGSAIGDGCESGPGAGVAAPVGAGCAAVGPGAGAGAAAVGVGAGAGAGAGG